MRAKWVARRMDFAAKRFEKKEIKKIARETLSSADTCSCSRQALTIPVVYLFFIKTTYRTKAEWTGPCLPFFNSLTAARSSGKQKEKNFSKRLLKRIAKHVGI